MYLDTKRMRVMRAEKDLSQDNVAKAAHISQNHYSAIERGCRTPRIEVLDAIAQALGCNYKELLM